MMGFAWAGTIPAGGRPTLPPDPPGLIAHVERALTAAALEHPAICAPAAGDLAAASAVLVLLGSRGGEPCLILNKRSERVRQPGDLCCPGGSVSPVWDARIARLLRLPLSPLRRWSGYRDFRRRRPEAARWMALFLATGLREAFEEMRLAPFRLKLLGPLPPHRLVLFRRMIFPAALWVPPTARFRPNWEVGAIVRIPLARLLDPGGYVRYRLRMSWKEAAGAESDYPAFRFSAASSGPQILWGATYRIVVRFLEEVFGFTPPPLDARPAVRGDLGGDYLTGRSC